jgi:hypothetical protein
VKRALVVLSLMIGAPARAAQDPPAPAPEQAEFFEKRIRPVLTEKCFKCHSDQAEKLKGALHLDTREGVLKGGANGPAVVPGDPDRSLLIKAVRWVDEDLKMPPKEKLKPDQIADFEQWVRMGAPDPRGREAKRGIDPEKVKNHWAFKPPREAAPPAVKNSAWTRTPIDAFLLAKLEEKGLVASPEADRRALIRRVTYDLTGLPPSPEEIDSFLADGTPDAYEKLVERLLASPHYGERWGRHWLDVARYADTKGYVYGDREESRFVHAHAYRDWVVRAFNEDLPFDRFLILQLAADRASDDRRDLAAMGYLTVGRRFINNIHDIIDDRIDTMARGMMAITIACARCHDHKFDPIPTADYYSLYGVFYGSAERCLPIADVPKSADGEAYEKELQKRQDALQKLFEKKRDALLDRLRSQSEMYLKAAAEVEKLTTEEFYQNIEANDVNPVVARHWHTYLFHLRKDFHPIFALWHAMSAVPEKDVAEKSRAWLAENGAKLNPKVAEAFAGEPPASMKDVASRYGKLLASIHKKWKEADQQKLQALEDPAEESLRQVLYSARSPIALPPGALSEIEWFFDEGTRVELGKAQRAIDQWNIDAKGAPPHAAILEDRPQQQNPRIFRRGNPANKGEEVTRHFLSLFGGQAFAEGSGRLELAKAVASAANPLTARVWVNRVWAHHFGQPLVRTPSDFGLRSEPPTHPELLDWLAVRFVKDGWSTKKLHRLILLSSAYRQSSADHPENRRIDADNRLLWRANRRRLDFEATRDSLLAASGLLDLTMGGRPAKLESGSRRRTIYGFIDRLNLANMYRAFDFASPDAHSPQRFTTTVPQQALFMMNSPFIVAQARGLLARVEAEKEPEARIRALYRIVYGRAPTEHEMALARPVVDAPIAQPLPVRKTDWLYGYGEVDEATGKVKSFERLPHFTGSAWQGGPALPDPALGWVFLTAQGGHAGNDLQHAAIRRWVAPRDGTVTVSGTVAHKTKTGNGIHARLSSSRHGEVGSWSLKQLEAEMKLKGLEVKKGDTLDFVVDFRGEITDDEFAWAPVIQMSKPEAATQGGDVPAEWSAAAEFTGPPPVPLSPWEKYAQVLLLANEFVFID